MEGPISARQVDHGWVVWAVHGLMAMMHAALSLHFNCLIPTLTTDMFEKYIPPTIIEMKKSYSHVTPLSTMNFLTTMVNILEGCIKPENVNNKADQAMFEMYFVFALIW